MADAKQKRNEQLKRWLGSETDLEPPVLKKKKTKVKFDDGAVFLAACSSGDTEEVLRMLDRGADINYANVDGLTALHQVRLYVVVVAGGGALKRGFASTERPPPPSGAPVKWKPLFTCRPFRRTHTTSHTFPLAFLLAPINVDVYHRNNVCFLGVNNNNKQRC